MGFFLGLDLAGMPWKTLSSSCQVKARGSKELSWELRSQEGCIPAKAIPRHKSSLGSGEIYMWAGAVTQAETSKISRGPRISSHLCHTLPVSAVNRTHSHFILKIPYVCGLSFYNSFFFSFFFSFCLFRAAPAAYGSSQARGQIGTAMPAYTTATATGSEL